MVRSKRSPLYIELRISRGHIFRGLFYEEVSAGLRVSIEVDGEELMQSGPWPTEDAAFASFERYLVEVEFTVSAKVDLSKLKEKGALLFVAKESSKWSIVAGLPSGKFVDTELRFDTQKQANEALGG